MPVVTQATRYGYRSTFLDPVTVEDTRTWSAELRAAVAGRESFSQFIDLRCRGRLRAEDEQEGLIAAEMAWVKAHGLLRSAVVVSDRFLLLKIKQLAFGTAVYEWERYLDGSEPRWERLALDWIERGLDPDTGAGAAPDPIDAERAHG